MIRSKGKKIHVYKNSTTVSRNSLLSLVALFESIYLNTWANQKRKKKQTKTKTKQNLLYKTNIPMGIKTGIIRLKVIDQKDKLDQAKTLAMNKQIDKK